MKPVLLLLFFICALFLSVNAQQPDFEGIIVYNTKVISKINEISAASWSRYLFWGDSVTMYIKKGYCKQVYPGLNVYYSPEKQKIYFRYKNIDSLFSFDYNYDSSKVLSMDKFSSVSYINNLPCNRLEITTDRYTVKYEYSPALHLNPAYGANNTGEHYDEYLKAAQSVYLRCTKETDAYDHMLTASRTIQQSLPDSLFALPNLPITQYQFESIGTQPQFKGGLDGYRRFLEKHLNGNLAAKYVEIPAGEKEAFQKVRLLLVLTEEGRIASVRAINRKDVHPLLADDAERTMLQMPRIIPATLFGQKIPFVYFASITYANSK